MNHCTFHGWKSKYDRPCPHCKRLADQLESMDKLIRQDNKDANELIKERDNAIKVLTIERDSLRLTLIETLNELQTHNAIMTENGRRAEKAEAGLDYLVEIVVKAANWPKNDDVSARAIDHTKNILFYAQDDVEKEKIFREKAEAQLADALARLQSLEAWNSLNQKISAERIRKDEREACAKVCEDIGKDYDLVFVSQCTTAIRAGGKM